MYTVFHSFQSKKLILREMKVDENYSKGQFETNEHWIAWKDDHENCIVKYILKKEVKKRS